MRLALSERETETHRCRSVRGDRDAGDVVAVVIVVVGVAHAVVQHPYSTGNRPEKWMGRRIEGEAGF